jgi:polysaccharide export outer membrane protein
MLMLVACLLVASLLCWAQAPDGKTKQDVPVAQVAAHTGAVESTPALTAQPRDDGFMIGDDDVLAINVWKEAEISRTVTVRSDGRISLPLIGEVQASAKTP